jgi:hypothetical protein
VEVNRDMVVKVGSGRYRVRIVYNKKGYRDLSLLGRFVISLHTLRIVKATTVSR